MIYHKNAINMQINNDCYRVNEADNSSFLDLMESYFSQKREDLMKDVHPELSYQVGATPDFTEV